ncbi:MAG: hypothetical protein Q8P76_01070 [bacterium]|nr:hypothetical protein [bacterium]
MTPETYREYFQKLREFTEFLRIFINEHRKKITPLPPELEAERQTHLKLFSNPKAIAICSPCSQCCYQGGSPLTAVHLIRLIMENPNFTLPMPDFEFLSQNTCRSVEPGTGTNYASEGYKCVFLGKAGCILKESRPRICYRFTCQTLKKRLDLETPKNTLPNEWQAQDDWVKKMTSDLNTVFQTTKMPENEFREILRDCLSIEGGHAWIAGPLGFDRAFRHEKDLCPDCQRRKVNTAFHND